ncbi:MAG: TIGR00730 family Rossman fold protein [Candidatus Woesearchaeota archaeon]
MSRLHKNKQYLNKSWTTDQVKEEIDKGLNLINSIDYKIVAFFGSHRVSPESKYYQHCKKLAYELGKNNYAILTGGGPGIMHAANSGATLAKAPSIGLKAKLLTQEVVKDNIYSHKQDYVFIFARRFIMSIKSEALIFYPGGYGTLNELFEYAVLMQTGIVDKVPIICVNKKYWQGLFEWLKDNPLKEDFFIRKEDLDLIQYADSVEEILKLIEKN